jgi:hypothetical protein
MTHAQDQAQVRDTPWQRDTPRAIHGARKGGAGAMRLAARVSICVGLLWSAPDAYGAEDVHDGPSVAVTDRVPVTASATVHPLDTPWVSRGMFAAPVKRLERVGERQLGLKLLRGIYATIGIRPLDRVPVAPSMAERTAFGLRYEINF